MTYESRDGDAAQAHRVASRTVIWAAASRGRRSAACSPKQPARRSTAPVRVVVLPDLSLAGHPEIAVVGDLAAAKSHGRGEPTPVPGVSPGAKQMGRAAAANLLRRLRGEATRPFRYRDYGNLATVGRKAAVVDLPLPLVGSLRFWGLAAWLFWLFAHIYFLIGFRNRLIVMLDWAVAYWSYERAARVVAEPPAADERERHRMKKTRAPIITLAPELERDSLLTIRTLLKSRHDLHLGDFEAKELLDWFCQEIGAKVYNQAIADIQKTLAPAPRTHRRGVVGAAEVSRVLALVP